MVKSMNNISKILIALLLLLMLSVVGCKIEGIELGDTAPNFKLRNLEGQSVSLSDFRGSPVLINFWATWCGYCLYEMPLLEEVEEDWADRGLVVLAVDSGESQARVEAFLEIYDISLLILLDTDRSVTRKYNVIAWPTTFFIDKDGIIQQKVIGTFPSKMTIERELNKIIP